MNLWKHQREEEIKSNPEAGGGEVNVIEEDGADIAEMWMRMQAKGILGAAVMHSAGVRIDEARAIAMMKNAQKCPQYMGLSEKNRALKRINDQIKELETIKDEREKFNGNE